MKPITIKDISEEHDLHGMRTVGWIEDGEPIIFETIRKWLYHGFHISTGGDMFHGRIIATGKKEMMPNFKDVI